MHTALYTTFSALAVCGCPCVCCLSRPPLLHTSCRLPLCHVACMRRLAQPLKHFSHPQPTGGWVLQAQAKHAPDPPLPPTLPFPRVRSGPLASRDASKIFDYPAKIFNIPNHKAE